MPLDVDNAYRALASRMGDRNGIWLAASEVVLILSAIGAIIADRSSLAVAFLVAAAAAAAFGVFRNFGPNWSGSGHKLQPEPTDAAIQRQQLSISVDSLARTLGVGAESLPDLQSAFIVAEDLALRQIQAQEKCPIQRHVTVAGIAFDAVYIDRRTLVCVEVVFLVSPEISDERIAAVLKKAATVSRAARKAGTGLDVRVMLLIITQLTPEDAQKLRSGLSTSRFSGTPVDIDIRFMDFEALQRIFVCE